MVPQECRSRIKRECLPLPLLYGLQDPASGPKLRTKLQSKSISNKDTQEIMELVHNSKAIKRFEKDMKALATKAELKLRTLRGNTEILLLLIEAMLPAIE
jgi:geranylgeranyl pyrophosphate synthase